MPDSVKRFSRLLSRQPDYRRQFSIFLSLCHQMEGGEDVEIRTLGHDLDKESNNHNESETPFSPSGNLELCCPNEWKKDTTTQQWIGRKDITELPLTGRRAEVLNNLNTTPSTHSKLRFVRAAPQPNTDNDLNTKETASQDTNTRTPHSNHQPLSLVFSQTFVNTFIWLTLLNQFFAAATTSPPNGAFTRFNTFCHSWLGVAFTITIASLVPQANAPTLRRLLSVPPTLTDAGCRSHSRSCSGFWIRLIVVFVAVTCAMNAVASLGLADDLIGIDEARRNQGLDAYTPSWAAQAVSLRSRFEWVQKVADASREWRVGEWLWRLMVWVHESDILVDWI